MRPLQSIGMGLVIVLVTASVGGYDLVADPVGWILVLIGVTKLTELPRQTTVELLAGLALAASVLIWVPGLREALTGPDPALAWAATLPQLACCAVLCRGLGTLAGDAGDQRASAWLGTAAVAFVVMAALPVLVFGGGIASLEATAIVAAALVLITLIWMLFSYSGRPWAGPTEKQRGPHPPEEERPS
jgi:hypothetical protein